MHEVTLKGIFMNKVLFVEDSPEVHVQVSKSLMGLCELSWAKTLEEAREQYAKDKFHLLLLDINLPDGSGIDFCSEVASQNPSQAIFIITGEEKLSDKVLGFTAGADDYIVKPFNGLELKARVEAKLKKINLENNMATVNEWEKLKVDKNRQEVMILDDQGDFESSELTHIEFKLLTYLSDREDMVIPRDEILNEIWGRDVYVYSRSVDTHVSKLRKKLGEASDYIKSVHGTGYKFSTK
jgi:two-component system phosphate regulon response regulator PhoB